MAASIALIIAVLLDTFGEEIPGVGALANSRGSQWLQSYFAKLQNFVAQYLGQLNDYFLFLLGFLPLALAMWLLKALVYFSLGAVGSMLLLAALLYYFFGKNDDTNSIDSPFVLAHERTFGIVFWFAIMGPSGALLYWFIRVAVLNQWAIEASDKIHAIAAWVPARLTGFIFALVGKFTSGFRMWFGTVANLASPSSEVLDTCGQAAIDTESENDAGNLVVRASIAWLALALLIITYS